MEIEMTNEEKMPVEAASGLNDGLGRCQTCKFWTSLKEDGSAVPSIKRREDVGYCECEKFSKGPEEDTLVDGLHYWDYEESDAGFATGENFGCVHHAMA